MTISRVTLAVLLIAMILAVQAFATTLNSRNLGRKLNLTSASSQNPCLPPSSADISSLQMQPETLNATLPGVIVPDVRSGRALYKSSIPESVVLNMSLVFKLRNPLAFEDCLASISDPNSANYGNFLNTTTLQPYLPTLGQEQSILFFLRERGFSTTEGPSPLVVRFTGQVGAAQKVFGIRMGLYSDGKSSFFASNADPKLPINFANLVTGIDGLDNYTVAKPVQTPCSGPFCSQAIQVGYALNQLYGSGFNGAGESVAVIDLPGDPDTQTAINTYSSQYNLPQTTLNIVYPHGTPSSWDPGWASETAMDVEAVHAVAPGANIVLVYDTVDPMDSIDYVATHSLASIVSNSWSYVCVSGYCSDTQLPSAAVTSRHQRLAVDAALGLTILFASGDQGAKPDGTNLGTEFPASDPNVLAVGATNLVLTGCGSYTCSGYGQETGASISGGGYSGFFAEPSWQTSTIGSVSGRAVPDVAMLGYSPNFWVYSTLSDKCGTSPAGAGWFYCAGTSLSTPLWAGFLAIALQMRGTAFGAIGPLLYQIASGSASLFHDVTSGSNGYSAAAGWDPVTGWGSPIANNLALALAQTPGNLGSALNAFDFRLSNSGTSSNMGGIAVQHGNSASITITVALVSGASQSVGLSCSSASGAMPQGLSCSFTPVSGSPSFSSTLTIITLPSTPVGTYTIKVTGTTSGISRSTLFTLAVT